MSNDSPRKLKLCHFKKGTEICNYKYTSKVLGVKLNRAVSVTISCQNCYNNGFYYTYYTLYYSVLVNCVLVKQNSKIKNGTAVRLPLFELQQ